MKGRESVTPASSERASFGFTLPAIAVAALDSSACPGACPVRDGTSGAIARSLPVADVLHELVEALREA
ncbi:MAG: hypothetical protein DHS20C15_12040 [Planctomycetota bacterium]|nr:MAG: hypothetical protein DHS20C15_12040 [Planctomycetota bacterium]